VRKTAITLEKGYQFAKAKKEDAAEINNLFKKMVDYMQQEGISQWKGCYPVRYNVTYLEKLIEQGHFFVIYNQEGKVVCATTCSFYDEAVMDYWANIGHEDKCLYLKHVVKDVDCSVKGIGEKLLKLAINEFPNAKIVRTYCLYNKTNESLLAFYNRLGFETIEVFKKPYSGDNSYALIELRL